MALSVFVPDQQEDFFTPALQSRLESKCIQIASNYGLSGEAPVPRFVLVPRLDLVQSRSVASAPPQVAVTLQVTYSLMGYNAELRFAQTTMNVAGVGRTDQEAYYQAINRIRPRSRELENFINDGREKIIAYYESNCDQIISEGDRLARMQQFEEAISIYMSIPAEASTCFDRSIAAAQQVYQRMIDQECDQLLLAAQAAAANRDFARAATLISHINAQASCTFDPGLVVREVSEKVERQNQQEWEYYMKQLEIESTSQQVLIEALLEISKSRYQQYWIR